MLEGEAAIARIRAHQIKALAQLDVAQVHSGDGARSMHEWVAARLDVTHETAGALVEACRIIPEHPESASRLSAGIVTFDRAAATAKLAASGASRDDVALSFGFDLAGVARLYARQHRITRSEERNVFRDRFVAIQPSLDNSSWRLWGRLPATDGSIVEQARTARAESLPTDVGGQRDSNRRRADALVSISQDSIDTPIEGSGGANVTVFVDASIAAATAGEGGAEVASGPRVGPATLERILCEGTVQVVAVDQYRPVAASSASRAIPPATRRFTLWRDGGCVIAACRSRYRLQPHHVVLRSHGGSHDAENLATLCWYHHHVAIHGAGFRLDPDSPPQRRRLLPPARAPDAG